MKRETWIVGPTSVRPNGAPDECFYCRAKFGTPHRERCSIRCRTVVVEHTFTLVHSLPEDWDAEMIEFHFNESSSCSNNVVEALAAAIERLGDEGCACSFHAATFLREATEADEEGLRLHISEEES